MSRPPSGPDGMQNKGSSVVALTGFTQVDDLNWNAWERPGKARNGDILALPIAFDQFGSIPVQMGACEWLNLESSGSQK